MPDSPNILFFQLDNVSPQDFGCYGGGMVIGAETPNIDRFASEGMMLTNYNTEAQCVPSRSALMTGRHSTRTGCVSVLPGCGLVSWELTIADQLKQRIQQAQQEWQHRVSCDVVSLRGPARVRVDAVARRHHLAAITLPTIGEKRPTPRSERKPVVQRGGGRTPS